MPSADAQHLQRIVEKQPACLMRVGEDGMVLAANDAALALLGAERHTDVLGKLITVWLAPLHQKVWREFAQSVTGGSSLSVECDVFDAAGVQRSVTFHGVPLVDHADGIPSMILGARDATALRRLEAALHESEAMRQKLVSEAREPQVIDRSEDISRLEAKIRELESDRDSLERSLSKASQLEQKLPQLEQLLKQGRVHLQDLRTRLAAATQERDELSARLHERETLGEQQLSSHATRQTELTERMERELADLRAQLADANAARDAIEARLSERQRELERLSADHAQLQQSLDEGQIELGTLRTRLEETAAERQLLEERLGQRAAELEQQLAREREELARQIRLVADQDERLRADALARSAERDEHQQALRAIETRIEIASGERARIETNLAALEVQHQSLLTETALRETERARLEEAYNGQRLHAAELLGQIQIIAEERDSALEQLRGLEDAYTQTAAQHEEERRRFDAERRAFEGERAGFQEERRGFEAERAGFQREREGFEAERAGFEAQRAGFQTQLAGFEVERAGFEAERVGFHTERAGFEAARAELESVRVELESDRSRLEQAMAKAAADLQENERALADHRIELQSMDVAIRQIEPLAAAGRMAVSIATELLTMVSDIDARTACLVTQAPLGDGVRAEVEQLRADAIRAASLARQILQANYIDTTEEPTTC